MSRLLVPAAIVGAIIAVALTVSLLPLPDPVKMSVATRLAPPGLAHPLGLDEYGRDVLSRILWGARASLSVAFLAAAVAGVIGTILGLLGGYLRGLVEIVTVRSAEAVLCFPPLLLALLVVTLMGPGAATLIVALSILYAPGYARVAYAQTLAVSALDYVVAQEALGARPGRILLRTILPNVAPPLLVQFSLTVAAAMVLESGLSFLGLGVVPPAPSWGLMIRGARSTMEQAPLLLLWPCLALTGTIVALNVLCDRLRDVLDPRAGTASAGFLGRGIARILPGVVDPATRPALLDVRGLTIEIATSDGSFRPVRDVSLSVAPGETLALVGESGSGKTLTGLAVLGLLPTGIRATKGRILFTGRDGRTRDLACLPEPALRQLRGDEIAMVFQDPGTSLNPVHRVLDQVAETIRAHRPATGPDAVAQAVGLLKEVGLPDPDRRGRSFPFELSGGQRQRAMIASAVANGPRMLIADEPTTALDVTIQAQILDLFARLRGRGSDTGLVFITHNLAVVAEIADRVAVMYAGEIVEEGPVGAVFGEPRHPYTAALIASVPDGREGRLESIAGTVPPPHAELPGCRFAPRCGLAAPECSAEAPPLRDIAPSRASRCLHWRDVA
ncbi:MAG: dipeptide/oligopeptide/nickel ABC transporter permease/ATP-binding protein [Alphaproteobacteria bacterium]|nr:dipeptide/oligopeptide/nickel ABC transporter permease/ATP-binding protein [Alphaproteobacteria bacterium]